MHDQTDAMPTAPQAQPAQAQATSSPGAAQPPRPARRNRLGAALFWCAGLAFVAVFYGEFLFSDRVGILDWTKDLYYFAFLHEALTAYGQLPLSFLVIPPQIDWFSTLEDLSYWSNPEVISLSPLLPLVYVLPFMVFMKTYFGLHLLAAVWGVRLLARRLGWDTGQALLLLVFFLGNPWLVQHLAIGYSPQISLCLLPAMAACLVRPTWRWPDLAAACLLSATVFYQGALHLFVWANLAVGCLAVLLAAAAGRPAILWRTGAFFAGSLILVVPKVQAVSAVYGGWRRIPGYGYQSLADLWGLLTDDVFPLFQFPETYSHYRVAFYDASIVMGAAFVVLGLWLAGQYAVFLFRNGRRAVRASAPDLAALVAAALFLVLGWGTVWRAICEIATPLASEIYPFRFLFVALNCLFFFIVSRLGAFTAATGRRWRVLAVYALAGLTCLTFFQRNRQLMPALTEQPDFIGRFSLPDYYADRITALCSGVRLPVTVTPNEVIITPSGAVGDRITLPWLPASALGGYVLEHARPVPGQPDQPGAADRLATPAVIEVTAASRTVHLRPKAHGRAWLLPAAGLVFTGFLAALARANRRWPGLFGQTP